MKKLLVLMFLAIGPNALNAEEPSQSRPGAKSQSPSPPEPPTITISKSDKLSIALGNLPPDLSKVLANDLAMSGYFKILPAGSANYVVSGGSGGSARVEDRAGKLVLDAALKGTARQQAHQLADEIVRTITGNPGIARTRVAFAATHTGKKEIYTADIDGANVTQLTHDNSISVSPCFSPDGSSLVYTGYQSGYADVYSIKLSSGSRSRIIKFPGTNSGAAYSPDGNRLAVTLSKDGNPELYVTSAGGGSPRRLTRTAGVESSPTWSPDGNELIYSSDDRGTPMLYRISASGSGGSGSPQPLATGHSYNTEPNWSPDGKKVVFNVRAGGSFAIAVLDLASQQTRIVGEGQDPVWGANSRHILFANGGSLFLLDAQTGQKSTLVSGLGKISEPTWTR